MIRMVHHVRGRARFMVPQLRGSKTFARSLEREILDAPAVSQASASPVTGKILVYFNEGESSPETIAQRIAAVREKLLDTLDDSEVSGSACSREPVYDGFADGFGVKADPFGKAPVAWHSMEMEQIAHHFQVSLSTGLAEPSIDERRARHGLNALPGASSRSFVQIVKDQVSSFPIFFIGVSAGLSALSGRWIEGTLALGVALVNAALGSIIEFRAERTIASAAQRVNLRAHVLRDRQVIAVPFEAVVPGDILDLHAGSYIAADARVVRADGLAVDEASLTGESMPVGKYSAALDSLDTTVAERNNMIFRGTRVVEGSGRAVVVATGLNTVLAKLQRILGEVLPPEAMIARELRNTAIQIAWLRLGATGLFAAVSLLRGHGLLRIATNGLALLVGAIPSGFSTLAVSAFALGHRNLGRNRIVTRRLRALGSLASVQVVCFDKTGTLTHNRMTAAEIFAGGKRVKVEETELHGARGGAFPLEDVELAWTIKLGVLCNETAIPGEGKELSLEGSSTERALLRLAEQAGINASALREEHPPADVIHRTEEHPFMTTIHPWDRGSRLTAMKGSPLEVLDRCSHYAVDGKVLDLDEEARSQIEMENFKMAGAGLRVLGVAYRLDDAGEKNVGDLDGASLVWAGLVGLADPVRKEAKPLIEALHRAGVKTVVITGDQSLTAQHIGEELGLSGEAPLTILDASDLQGQDLAAMRSLVMRAHIFARLSPTQKLYVIQAYQSAGMSVIMVGDGFNDILALKVADVGIAMGMEGAGLARESADLVLEDDDLRSVMLAIATGRAFYRNVRRSRQFLLTSSHVELASTLVGRNSIVEQGIGAWQSLWTSLIYLSFSLDQPGELFVEEKPAGSGEGLTGTGGMKSSLLDAAAILAGASAAGGYGLIGYDDKEQASRLFLSSVSVNQVLYALTCRGTPGESCTRLTSNPLLQGIVAMTLGAHLLGALLSVLGKPLKDAASPALDILALGVSGLLSRKLLETGLRLSECLPSWPLMPEASSPDHETSN